MKTISKIKQYGFVNTVKIVLEKFFKTRVLKLHYLKIQIDSQRVKDELKTLSFDIKELNYNDFLLGDETVFYGEKLNLIRERFQDNSYTCYGVVINNLLVFSGWISSESLGLPMNLKMPLKDDEGLLEDVYCHPNSRGQGMYSKMLFYYLLKLNEMGKKSVIAIVLDGNAIAYKVKRKAGFNDLGIFYMGEIFGVPFKILNKKKYDSR